MSIKIFDIPSVGPVKVAKRKGTRSIRIRLASNGEIMVSQPTWLPYSAGTEFARTHKDWIEKHRTAPSYFAQNMPIGKSHTLIFVRSQSLKITTKLKGKYATVMLPLGMTIDQDAAQAAAKKIARKALIAQKPILEERISYLAATHNYSYTQLHFKFMKSKWGSRKSDGSITLNYRLLDLSSDLIDYVLCHELAHTKHMNHSTQFWELVTTMVPDYKKLRKTLKAVKLTW